MKAQVHKRPNIADVAALAGVSRTTVSCVLNEKSGGSIRITDETRDKVQEAIKTLDYRPSVAARALRTRRSHLLALMVPYIETPFHPLFAAAIQREAQKANLGLVIYASRDDPAREADFIDDCISRGVDGVIAQSFRLTEANLARLVEAGVSVVIHGVTPTHPSADNVVFDEVEAVEAVVSHLISKGHSRIAAISMPQDRWPGRLRLEGYRNALESHGLSFDPALICEVDYTSRGSGTAATRHLLSLAEPPSAVFASNDLLAIDAMLFALDAGLSVPKDVAIVGFDDIPEAVIVRPKLTTVRKDTQLLGAAAVRMLVERIGSEEMLPGRQEVLRYEIMYRQSA